MKNKGMTQNDISNIICLSQSYVSKILNKNKIGE